MADAHALGACGETRGGSSPLPPIICFLSELTRRHDAAVIQLVECHLAKVDVKGSSPFRRSKYILYSFGGLNENQRFFTQGSGEY